MIIRSGVEYKQFHLYKKGRFVLRVENRGWATPWDEELRLSVWAFMHDWAQFASILGTLWVVTHLDTATAEIKTTISNHELSPESKEYQDFLKGKQLLIDNVQELFGYGWKVKDRSE